MLKASTKYTKMYSQLKRSKNPYFTKYLDDDVKELN